MTARSSSTGSGNVLQIPDSTTSRTGNTVSLTTSGQSQITFRFYAYWTESTSGTGGLAGNLTFTGTLVQNPASPMITANGTLAAVSTTYGTASTTPTSFTVSGADMTEGIKVTPPAGFEVSTSSTFASGVGNSASPITIGSTGTIAQTTVYVRLAATAPVASSPFSGNIVLSSAGATSVNVATAASTVTPKPLSVNSPTIASKVYDGNTTSGAVTVGTLSGFVGSETVTATAVAAAYSGSNVGSYSNVTVTYTLANGANGGLAANYSLAAGSATGVITTKPLTGTFTASNKTYDGTTAATVASRAVNGKVGSDDVNHTGGTATFANATVGNTKTVTLTSATLTGAAASNYSLSSVSTATANITTKALTITGASATNRGYDGTTTVAVTGGSLVGVVSPDAVTLGGSPTGTVTTATVGDGKAVTVTGYSISGAQAGNYSLTQPTGLTVNITKATPTITTAPTASPITYGQTLADSTLSGGSASTAGSFAFTTPATDPNAGTASQDVTFTPTDAANYNTATGTVDVTVAPRNLTITGLTGNNKAADGTTKATASGTAALQGVEAGDSVSLAGTPVFTFATAGVGTGITITTTGYTLAGENAGNYTLTQPLLSANILDVPVLVTGTAGSITRTTAQISGNEITSDGGSAISERGVVFSTNAQPTVSDTKVAVAGELGAFAASLSGLTGGTTYYVRAYATNALTTVYGSAISFTANATPVFSGMALTVTKGGSLQIIESKLRPRITDAESNPVTITGAAATSQHSGTVTRSNRVITYTPSASFSGNDTFAVTVDDGFGASNITLTVAVTEDPLFTSAANAPRITTLDGGAVRVTFNGIPGRTYGIQRSTTMSGGTWTQISAVTAGSNSVATFDDPNPPSPSAFYRIAFPAQ